MKNKKWKQAGALAVMLALAATPVFASPLTEYTDAEMAAFRDNTLEYWEIPGLVEHYNPSYLNQLETFYGNPSGTDGTSMEGMMGLLKDSLSGLSVEQLKNLADELRATASDLEDELDEMELDKNDPLYQDYKSNIKSMKKYAKDAEARMDGTAAARRALKLVKNQMTIDLSAKMRSYQLLKVQDEIQQKKLEIAQLTYDSAVRQMELGMYAKENVLVAADGLNAARSAADASAASLNQVKQGLITALGWEYNGNPDILAVPEPNLEKIAGCSLEKDMESALSMNYDISDLRKTDAKAQGGVNEKKKKIREQEDKVRMEMEYLYRDMMQKQLSYETAVNGWMLAESDKAQADRKFALGMISKQEHLTAEAAWLTSKMSYEKSALNLTASVETYDWAVKGMLSTASADQTGR